MGRARIRDEIVGEESLLSRLATGERLGQAQLLNLIDQLADELRDVHAQGRIHGTITPADIRFDATGEVSLTGYGRDTTPDAEREKPYAPVELYAPVHNQGPWTDIYSLGAVLWHAITGERPPEVLLRKGDLTLERLAPSGFDPAFLRAVDAAVQVAPQRRPQTLDAWLSLFPRPAGATVSRLPPRQVAPTFPIEFSAELLVPARPRAPKPPLFTIAALNGVAAYLPPQTSVVEEAPPAGVPAPLAEVANDTDVVTDTVTAKPTGRFTRWAGRAALVALFAAGALTLLSRQEEKALRPSVGELPAVGPVTPQPEPQPAPVQVAEAPPVEPAVVPPTAAVPPLTETKVAEPVPPKPTPAKPTLRERKPVVKATPDVAPTPVKPEPEPVETAEARPEPSLEGATPRALLARADRRLEDLFSDYERLRARVARSYDDKDLPQSVKERAYRETARLHEALLDLRKDRNRIARTDRAGLANRRYDAFETSAARIDAGLAEVRRSL